MKTSLLVLALLSLLSLATLSCKSLLYGSSDYEDAHAARVQDQTYFEDSAKVFFINYPNPYPDRELLWFCCYLPGAVELRVVDAVTDSARMSYRFRPQDIELYTIAINPDSSGFFKSLLYVDGRLKCARITTAWRPIEMPQWKTKYELVEW